MNDQIRLSYSCVFALMLSLASQLAAANQELDGLADNSWIRLNPVPSLRYKAVFRNPEATEAQTPADRVATRQPAWREYSHPVYADGKIFYFGGGHSGYAGNDVEIYDIERNVWTQSY